VRDPEGGGGGVVDPLSLSRPSSTASGTLSADSLAPATLGEGMVGMMRNAPPPQQSTSSSRTRRHVGAATHMLPSLPSGLDLEYSETDSERPRDRGKFFRVVLLQFCPSRGFLMTRFFLF
jgi:hypothetical protein